MTLESDTNRVGLNAIARAHAVMGLMPELLKQIKAQVTSPSWGLATAVTLMTQQTKDHLEQDLAALEELYAAMGARGNASV